MSYFPSAHQLVQLPFLVENLVILGAPIEEYSRLPAFPLDYSTRVFRIVLKFFFQYGTKKVIMVQCQILLISYCMMNLTGAMRLHKKMKV